ncbi:putative PIN and TRAM-domain containing protein precursor [Rosistilla oblonga]|uniref:Putative PIN and TRAM-domain containing protein n=1 Tax=Rosistilla oblonga TaxID=2527990 RepID=A0A518IYP7_9BACT|nr:PIN domain-containing protein [Rosistilla oblonga]QDV13595.1 putative PIN and TRAM-domain containing protein precursor [Rosistilla oblonga]QDV58213.1 putative PIN and TRAM-domain containing protein precursor [Rosistilla oblonga]
MGLLLLRAVFLLVAGGISALINYAVQAANSSLQVTTPAWVPWANLAIVMGLALAVIAIDVFVPNKRIDAISSIYFGLLVGVLLTYVLTIALAPLLAEHLQTPVRLVTGMVLCYICISLLLQTKDDFRFIIPYVEFVREVKGFKPLILDTSVVIDGRIEDLVSTGIFDNQLIMPRFALSELQGIADSSDKLRRARGRRGLDVLNRLRANDAVDLQIFDRDLPEFAGQAVDLKLVLLAKHLEGKVVTGDFNLNKVAKIHNVPVINLNEIANSLKPMYLPGEQFQLKVIKAGEGQDQGIGYLEDGTMVVVEGGRDKISKDLMVTVTSTLQTSAGRMIFTRHDV